MRHPIAIALVLLITCFAAAQSAKKSTRPPKPPSDPWLERARAITAEIEYDRDKLPWHQAAMLPARLASLWAKADPKRSQAWMSEAVRLVETIPLNESDEHREQRMAATLAIFHATNRAGSPEAGRLLKLLTASAKRTGPFEERRNANFELAGIISNAIQESLGDPKRTAELTRALFPVDLNEAMMIANSIRYSHPELGLELMQETGQMAWRTFDTHALTQFSMLVFPAYKPPPRRPQMPESLRQMTLNMIADGITRVAQNADEKREICRLSAEGARLLPEMPAARAGQVRAAIDACREFTDEWQKERVERELVRTAERDDPLRAAADAADPKESARLKQEAARKVARDEPARALEILDSLTPEERRAQPQWTQFRSAYSIQALQQLYKRGDFQAIQQLLDRTPDDDRAAQQLNYGGMLARDKNPLAITILADARREMSQHPSPEPHIWLSLLTAYANQLPTELPQVLSEVIAGLNALDYGWRSLDPEGRIKMRANRFSDLMEPVPLTPTLLELEPAFLSASLQQLTSVADRQSFRLGLLEACLARREKEKAKPKRGGQSGLGAASQSGNRRLATGD